MHILAIDIGNTRAKWGLHDGTTWVARGETGTRDIPALAAQWDTLPVPARIVISNVAGAAAREALLSLLARWQAEPCWIVSQASQCGVTNGYDNPAQLGCDRWAALIAARRRAPGPCLVVTVGTAMTVDALSGEGRFLGGLIVPGPALMREALSGNTGQLGNQPGRQRDFPTNTADAMQSGALAALAGAVAMQHERLRGETGAAPVILLSGGAASLIKSHLPEPIVEVDNLVLEGLVIIANEPCH